MKITDDKNFYYYKDNNGEPYIVENNTKYNIAIPEYIEKVTDEILLTQLRSETSNTKISTYANSNVLYSKTVYFNPLVKTGFSYWILYSMDNTEWYRAFFANESLTFYTRHARAEFGNAPYIVIHIFSYYGTVSSCVLSIKDGDILG